MYILYFYIVTILPSLLFFSTSILIFISIECEIDILKFLPSSFVYYSMVQSQRLLNLLCVYDSIMSYNASKVKISKKVSEDSFLFLGDSFFTFWKTLDDDFRKYKIDVVNGGFGGATTQNIIQNIKHFKRKNWNCIVINIGDNDYFINNTISGLSQDIERIAKEFSCMVYILILPVKPSYTIQYIDERRVEFEKLDKVKISNVKICDLTHLKIEKKDYFKDGIHIRKAKRKTLAAEIYKHLVI